MRVYYISVKLKMKENDEMNYLLDELKRILERSEQIINILRVKYNYDVMSDEVNSIYIVPNLMNERSVKEYLSRKNEYNKRIMTLMIEVIKEKVLNNEPLLKSEIIKRTRERVKEKEIELQYSDIINNNYMNYRTDNIMKYFNYRKRKYKNRLVEYIKSD